MNIPLVVSAHDRPSSLQRLLASLAKATYPADVKLIISIDGGGPPEVTEAANSFEWTFGEKQIIHHQENLGLRSHILFCGSLAKEYDGIILLEDDLYVAPAYYNYAMQAATYYRGSDEVSGIALYAPAFNENALLPFYPLHDGNDVYFMQTACSWGQLWLKEHWEAFEIWHRKEGNADFSDNFKVPYIARNWPATSWKKIFLRYMIENNKFFVYPRYSLTTNFGDEGRHMMNTALFQVPLLHGEICNYSFVDFKESKVKYDAFGELQAEALVSLSPHLNDVSVVVDLYGIKEFDCFDQEYVLTSKKCTDPLFSYCRGLIPIESNIIDNIPGDDLFLSKAEEVCRIEAPVWRKYIHYKCTNIYEQLYFYNISSRHYLYYINQIKKYQNESNEKDKVIAELHKNLRGNNT